MPAYKRPYLLRYASSIGGLSFHPLGDNIQVQMVVREVRNRTLHRKFIEK